MADFHTTAPILKGMLGPTVGSPGVKGPTLESMALRFAGLSSQGAPFGSLSPKVTFTTRPSDSFPKTIKFTIMGRTFTVHQRTGPNAMTDIYESGETMLWKDINPYIGKTVPIVILGLEFAPEHNLQWANGDNLHSVSKVFFGKKEIIEAYKNGKSLFKAQVSHSAAKAVSGISAVSKSNGKVTVIFTHDGPEQIDVSAGSGFTTKNVKSGDTLDATPGLASKLTFVTRSQFGDVSTSINVKIKGYYWKTLGQFTSSGVVKKIIVTSKGFISTDSGYRIVYFSLNYVTGELVDFENHLGLGNSPYRVVGGKNITVRVGHTGTVIWNKATLSFSGSSEATVHSAYIAASGGGIVFSKTGATPTKIGLVV